MVICQPVKISRLNWIPKIGGGPFAINIQKKYDGGQDQKPHGSGRSCSQRKKARAEVDFFAVYREKKGLGREPEKNVAEKSGFGFFPGVKIPPKSRSGRIKTFWVTFALSRLHQRRPPKYAKPISRLHLWWVASLDDVNVIIALNLRVRRLSVLHSSAAKGWRVLGLELRRLLPARGDRCISFAMLDLLLFALGDP